MAVALTAAMERLVLSVGHGVTTAGPGGRPAIAVRLAMPGIRPRRAAAETAV